MSNNEVVPFSDIESNDIDLNLVVEQGQKMTETLKKMGIKEATFESGVYYKNDSESKTTTIATDGILIQEKEHTTTVVFRNEGSTKDEALNELNSGDSTQKVSGAFSGKSQQSVSKTLIDSDVEQTANKKINNGKAGQAPHKKI